MALFPVLPKYVEVQVLQVFVQFYDSCDGLLIVTFSFYHTYDMGFTYNRRSYHVRYIGEKLERRDTGSVCGLTLINRQLYVLHWADEDQIDVYSIPPDHVHIDAYTPKDFVLLDTLSVPAKKDDLRDMTSCPVKKRLYIANNGQRCLHKIEVEDDRAVPVKWAVDKRPHGLSVISANHHILVTCRDDGYLIELDPEGYTIQKIRLPESVVSPRHAFRLDSGAFLVSYGHPRSSDHRVCKVTRNGEVSQSFDGQGVQLREPCHMALGRSGFVFVADFGNGRVTMLTPSLQFVRDVIRDVIGHDKELVRFQRLYLDNASQNLYVGDFGGNVTIIRLIGNP